MLPSTTCLHRAGCFLRSGMAALWLLCLLLAAPAAQALSRTLVGTYTITQWTVEDGLPHNLPLAITQDRAGWMWVATWEGVVRFNGHAFTAFNRRNSNGIDLAGASTLLAREDGSMLAGTSHGVYRYRRGQWQVVPGLVGVRAEMLFADSRGGVWVASGQRVLRLGADQTLQEMALGAAPFQVFGFAELADGQILLGTENGLFAVIQDRVQPWTPGQVLAGTPVLHAVRDRDGWLLATVGGAWLLRPDGQLTPLGPRQRVNRAVRGPQGALWINPHQGELMVLAADGRQQTLPVQGRRSRSLFVDRDGGVWGGSTHGLFRVVQGAAQELPGSAGYVRAVMQADDGAIWVGHDSGLRRLADGKVHDIAARVPALAGASVMALGRAADGNGVWVGTYDRGVYRLDASGRLLGHLDTSQGRTSAQVRAVLETADGTVWIGASAMGLLRWRDGQLQRIDPADTLPIGHVQVLYDDPQGGVLVGGTDGMAQVAGDGSVRYWSADSTLPARSVYDFLRDADGTLWVATDRGLLRLRNDRFAVLDHRLGLPQERLFRLLDTGDKFWLSSHRGVLHVAREQVEAVLDAGIGHVRVWVVDRSDGLPAQTNGGSWPAGWRTAAGELLFATGNGVGQVLPDRLHKARGARLGVEIEQVSVDGQAGRLDQPVVLAADARRLRVDYIGLDFQAPDRVRYRYRLLGFDPEWIEAGRSVTASYTNLPAGEYRFEVEAVPLPRDWEDRARIGTASLPVIVRAPFWQHPGVIGLALVGLGAGVYGIVWLRTRRYRQRQLQLQRVIATSTRVLTVKNDMLEANARERDALLQQLAHQASHDTLTGLPNRRAAESHLQRAYVQAQTHGTPLSVALLDVDHFKAINDGYGHDAGDCVLRALGERLSDLRGTALYGSRHGGEEFLLVLEGLGEQDAWEALERLRRAIAAAELVLDDGRRLRYTVSIGLATLGGEVRSLRQMLATADSRLYVAKGKGRNRVVG